MFHLMKRLYRMPHVLFTLALQALVSAVAGWLQGSGWLTVAGVASAVLVIAVVVVGRACTALGAPALQGEAIVAQQPQLTDVQAHMRRTKELSRVF